MKVRVSLEKIYILLYIVIASQVLALYSTGWTGLYYSDFINVSLIILSFMYFIMKQFLYRQPFLFKKNLICFWVLCGIFIYVCVVLYSCMKYREQTLGETISCSFSYILLFGYITLYDSVKKNDNYKFLIRCIMNIGFLTAGIKLIQVILYNYGIVFMDIGSGSVFSEDLRFGALRIRFGWSFCILALIVSLFDYLRSKEKNINVWCFALSVIDILFVIKTRSLMLIVFPCILLGMYVSQPQKSVKRILLISMVLLTICYLLGSGVLWNVYSVLVNDKGNQFRLQAIRYYISGAVKNPFWGMGFIKGTMGGELGSLLHGTAGRFYRDDVGIIGFFNEMGMIGVCWFMSLIITMIRKQQKYGGGVFVRDAMNLCIIAFIIVSSINLFMLNKGPISTFVILLVLFEKNFGLMET